MEAMVVQLVRLAWARHLGITTLSMVGVAQSQTTMELVANPNLVTVVLATPLYLL